MWTGSEMIVWGGYERQRAFEHGGRYNPAANTWTALTTTGAPAARSPHGGVDGQRDDRLGRIRRQRYLNDGGRYNPTANSLDGGHHHRRTRRALHHTAVWTGSEMIVWGGLRRQQLFERRRALQSGGQQLDGGHHHRRTRRARLSHGGVDGQRDDRLGRIQPYAALLQRRRALQSD